MSSFRILVFNSHIEIIVNDAIIVNGEYVAILYIPVCSVLFECFHDALLCGNSIMRSRVDILLWDAETVWIKIAIDSEWKNL